MPVNSGPLKVRRLTADYGGGEAKRACSCRWARPPSRRISDRRRQPVRTGRTGTRSACSSCCSPLAVVSEAVPARHQKVKVSAAFLSLVLGMALMGPAPAACLGALVMMWSCALQAQPVAVLAGERLDLRDFTIVGGVIFDLVGIEELLETAPAAFMLVVFTIFMATNVLNFLLIAIDFRVFEGWPVWTSFRQIYVPLAPGRVRDGSAHGRRGLRLPGRQPRRDRPARADLPGLPVPAAHRAQLDGAQGRAGGPDARARRRSRSGCSARCSRRSRSATR